MPDLRPTPLRDPSDLDPLLERIGDARYVLLGEASHGTHEYYAWRAEISKRLIAEHGFSFVAVEGDWPDCMRVNRHVKHADDLPDDSREVLRAFDRWPTWMWANEEVADFATWLRQRNAGRPRDEMVGFYGLDVYSLWESMRSILEYLEEHEPEHVEAAKQAWRCFEPYREDPQEYAWATRFVPQTCEDAVVRLLTQLCSDRAGTPDGDPEARFDAEQNAAVAAGAERYYRTMIRGDQSWNVRDCHMVDTLDRLVEHHGDGAKAIVWEHNTHVGDARFTDMARDGLVNVGQLVRERHERDGVVIVGFGGYEGSVIAGDAWGAPMERMPVPKARRGSVEERLSGLGRAAGLDAGLFVWPERDRPRWLDEANDHRAIGVVYHPQREAWGNYVPSVMGRRYDAFLHFDTTQALHPLHLREVHLEEPVTFPSGR